MRLQRLKKRGNNHCPAKLHRDLGSVAILFGCSVFLLHKSVKLGIPIQMGEAEAQPFFCPTYNEVEEYCVQKELKKDEVEQ